MEPTTTPTNGHTHEPIGATTTEDIREMLTKVLEQLDVISRLACPVCAPVVIAENHPERVRTD